MQLAHECQVLLYIATCHRFLRTDSSFFLPKRCAVSSSNVLSLILKHTQERPPVQCRSLLWTTDVFGPSDQKRFARFLWSQEISTLLTCVGGALHFKRRPNPLWMDRDGRPTKSKSYRTNGWSERRTRSCGPPQSPTVMTKRFNTSSNRSNSCLAFEAHTTSSST